MHSHKDTTPVTLTHSELFHCKMVEWASYFGKLRTMAVDAKSSSRQKIERSPASALKQKKLPVFQLILGFLFQNGPWAVYPCNLTTMEVDAKCSSGARFFISKWSMGRVSFEAHDNGSECKMLFGCPC
jgi:hypothetical protein